MRALAAVAVVVIAVAGAAAAAGCGSSRSAGPPDLALPAEPLSCGEYVDCLNGARTPAAGAECDRRATGRGRVLFGQLDDCIGNQCASDAGLAAGACGAFETCVFCVQSGRGPGGRSNGSCVNDAFGQSSADGDPLCGRCVDEVLSCYTDVR